MIRMVGAVLLTMGSAALGIGSAVRLKNRVKDLRGVIRGLESMERCLASDLEPLEGMLAEAVQDTDGRPKRLFEFCLGQVKGNTGNFGGLWQAALDTECLCLCPDDMQELRQLGSVLGRYDGDSQSAVLKQSVCRLEGLLAEAEEQSKRLGKVYGTTGISAGLLLTILLL